VRGLKSVDQKGLSRGRKKKGPVLNIQIWEPEKRGDSLGDLVPFARERKYEGRMTRA